MDSELQQHHVNHKFTFITYAVGFSRKSHHCI